MSKKLFVISGPSGAGIRDIAAAVFARRADVRAIVPVTARKMKAGEQNGVGYYFYDLDGWNELKAAGDLLECTEFAGNDYGTSRRLVQEALDGGHSVLLTLEVERAAQLKRSFPEAVCVYIEPSPAVLEERYRAIARSAFEVPVRLSEAERQRALSDFCDARFGSDDEEAAVRELCALIDRETA